MRTAHRTASKAKRQNLNLPKFWRSKISPQQVLDARIVHWDLVTRFTDGTATHHDLWDWVETGYTYSQVMRLHVEDGTEFTAEAMNAIAEQLSIYESVIERFGKTGRAGFSPSEYQIAKAAAYVMDDLLEIDRHGIAERAAYWSMDQMKKLRSS